MKHIMGESERECVWSRVSELRSGGVGVKARVRVKIRVTVAGNGEVGG